MPLPVRLFVAGTLAAALASLLSPSLAARQEAGGAALPGLAVYDKTCSRCHGPEGQEGKAPELIPFRWNYKQALDIVRHGGTCGMPAFPESELSDDEVKQIVDYLKTVS